MCEPFSCYFKFKISDLRVSVTPCVAQILNLQSEITRVPSQLSDSSCSTSNTLSAAPSSLPKSPWAKSPVLLQTDALWRPGFLTMGRLDHVNETSDLTGFRAARAAESYHQ